MWQKQNTTPTTSSTEVMYIDWRNGMIWWNWHFAWQDYVIHMQLLGKHKISHSDTHGLEELYHNFWAWARFRNYYGNHESPSPRKIARTEKNYIEFCINEPTNDNESCKAFRSLSGDNAFSFQEYILKYDVKYSNENIYYHSGKLYLENFYMRRQPAQCLNW